MIGHSIRYKKCLKLAREHRAWLVAECRLKPSKQFSTNAPVAHNLRPNVLCYEIAQYRVRMRTVHDENQRIKSDLTIADHQTEIAKRLLWKSIETIQNGFIFLT